MEKEIFSHVAPPGLHALDPAVYTDPNAHAGDNSESELLLLLCTNAYQRPVEVRGACGSFHGVLIHYLTSCSVVGRMIYLLTCVAYVQTARKLLSKINSTIKLIGNSFLFSSRFRHIK